LKGMIKYIFVVFGLSLTLLLNAQESVLLNLALDSTFHTQSSFLRFNANAGYRSNALDNAFMQKMVLGGTVGRDTKSNIGGRLKPINRTGGRGMIDFSYYNFSDSLLGNPNFGFLASAGSYVDIYAAFPGDFYRTLFEGNSQFAGQTVDYSDLQSAYVAYQKVGVGIFDKNNFSELRLSYVIGQDFFRASTTEASLYTSILGDSLLLRYNGDFSRSDTSFSGFGVGNGAGFALDLKFNFPLQNDEGLIRFSLNDIGGIFWNEKSLDYRADSELLYQGILIDDLFDEEFSNIGVPNLEDTLVYEIAQKAKFTWLPSSFGMNLLKRTPTNDYWELGIRVKPDRANLPLIHGAYHYCMDKNTIVAVTGAWGGYGNLRVGASFEKVWNNWYFNLASTDLPGLILENLRGKDVYFTLGKFFGKDGN
jgi:hypothetical protein